MWQWSVRRRWRSTGIPSSLDMVNGASTLPVSSLFLAYFLSFSLTHCFSIRSHAFCAGYPKKKSVEIVSEELFYNAKYQPFRVICVSECLTADPPVITESNDLAGGSLHDPDLPMPEERSLQAYAHVISVTVLLFHLLFFGADLPRCSLIFAVARTRFCHLHEE